MAEPLSIIAAFAAVGTVLATQVIRLASSFPTSERHRKKPEHFGIRRLGNEPENPTADICFVHGLYGNWKSTWSSTKSEGESNFWWPADIQKQTNARILLYGYDSIAPTAEYLVRRTLYHHAQSLVESLAKERAEHPKRPLIFVAHSLGGVIVKSGLILSSQARGKSDQMWNVSLATTGIVFLATPQTDPVSSFGSVFTSIARASGVKPKTLKELDEESRVLQSYLHAFESLSSDISIVSFFESRSTTSIGLIVPPPKTLRGAAYEQLDLNHANMTRFQGPDDRNYIKVKDAIRKLCESGKSEQDRKWATRLRDPRMHETSDEGLINFRIPSQLPPRSSNFVGRAYAFEWLEETLLKPCPPNCPHDCHKINLYGPAAIGKTQIALEFAYRFSDRFSSVFWIPSYAQATAENVFDELARTLRLPSSRLGNKVSARENAYSVMEWLMNDRNSDWLLIFDDVDLSAIPSLEQLIPNPTCFHGHVIITSRAQIDLPFTKPYKVEELMPAEARALLEGNLGMSGVEGYYFSELSRVLGGNPLALTMAHEFMRNSGYSPRKYLQAYERTGSIYPPGYSDPLAPIFSRDIKRISGLPAEMLFSMCCMRSRPIIPLWIFEESSQPFNSKRQLRKSIAILQSANLIVQQPDQTHIMIHRVVRDYGQTALPETIQLEACRELCETASYVVVALKQNSVRRVGPVRADLNDFDRELIELIVDVLAIILSHGASSKQWDVDLEELGKFCQANGKFSEAAKLYELHIERKGDDIPETQLRLGISRRRTGELLDIETPSELLSLNAQFNEAVEIADAESLQDLKSLNRERGDPEQELGLLQKIVQAQETLSGPMNPSTLDSIQELSQRLCEQGYLEEAEALSRRLLYSYRKLYGSDHPSATRVLELLTSICTSAGKLGEAESFCKETIDNYERRVGIYHASTQKCQAQLAFIYHLQGRYEEAEQIFADTIHGLDRTIGHETPEMLRIQENHAQNLIKLGKTRNDVEMWQQGLVLLESILSSMEAYADMHPMATRRRIASLLSRGFHDHRDITKLEFGRDLGERVTGLEKKYGLDSNSEMMDLSG